MDDDHMDVDGPGHPRPWSKRWMRRGGWSGIRINDDRETFVSSYFDNDNDNDNGNGNGNASYQSHDEE
jgi:hypothetical protein